MGGGGIPEGVWQTILNIGKMNASRVKLTGVVADLVRGVCCKIMQDGLCDWEALPLYKIN